MNLSDVLDKNIVITGMEAKDKMDILCQLANILKQNDYIEDEAEFVEDILKREEEGITGIGQGLAIPHGKSKTVKKVGVAIANLKNKIEWESLDDEKVSTVVLFCVSDDDSFARNHMILLSQVAAKLANDDLLYTIKNSVDPEEIISCFIS